MSKKRNKKEEDTGIEFYFDGGSQAPLNGGPTNPGCAGYGWFHVPEKGERVLMGWGGIGYPQSNNRGEICGALNIFKNLEKYYPEPQRVTLFGDSEYVLGALVNLPDTLDGYKHFLEAKPLWKNQELWEEIIRVRQGLIESGYEFGYNHVFGHTGVFGNEVADMLATRGVVDSQYLTEPTNEVVETTVTQLKTPKKPKTPIPAFICDQLIFDWSGESVENENRNVIYLGSSDLNTSKPKGEKDEDKTIRYATYQGSYDKLRSVGRPCAEDRYSVVLLKEPFKMLEAVREHQKVAIQRRYETQQFVAYRTSELLSAQVLNLYEEDRIRYLHPVRKSGALFSLTYPRKEVSEVFNPPRLAFKISDKFEEAYKHLLMHLNGEKYDHTEVVTDVTELFFTSNEKGKLAVNPDITSTTKNIKVPADSFEDGVLNLFCVVGIDTPTRNALNKMIKLNPTVKVLTWKESADAYFFAFVITTDEGEMYWNCPYGSKHLLRNARKAKRK